MSKPFEKIKSGSVTVPIYRSRHKSTATGFVFTASYYDHQRIRRQIQRSSLDAVREEARRVASNLAACKAEAANFSSHDREELLMARKLCGETPLLAALQELNAAKGLTDGNLLSAARLWADSSNRQFEPKLVSEVVDAYIQVKAAAGKQVGVHHASEFRNIKTDFGSRNIHEISTPEINRWLQKRKNPWTMLTYRKRIIALFRWAQGQRYIPQTGRTAAEFSELPETPRAPIGIISPDCLRRLLQLTQEKSPRDLPALVLSAMCGMRRKEVNCQKWEDIRLDRGYLSVTAAKRGTESYRRIDLCDAARAWLAPFRQSIGAVCEGVATDRIRKLGREAGLILPENAFRHSFVTYLVAQTANTAKVALAAGHSEKTLTKHYKEIASEEDAEIWFSIFPDKPARVASGAVSKQNSSNKIQQTGPT